MVDYRALQAQGGTRTRTAEAPVDVKPRWLTMGSWHANFHKEGVRHQRSRGGLRKHVSKTRIRIGIGIYKDKIFTPVMLHLK